MSFKDDKQFSDFYKCHRQAVYFLAAAILKDSHAAEDITQNVFLYLNSSKTPVNIIVNPKAFLAKAVKNLCLNYIRDNKKSTFFEDIPTFSDEIQGCNIEDAAVYSIELEQILSCLKNDERTLFSLHYFDKYSYRELSAVFDMPIGTVQTKCHCAKKKIKKCLKIEGSAKK